MNTYWNRQVDLVGLPGLCKGLQDLLVLDLNVRRCQVVFRDRRRYELR